MNKRQYELLKKAHAELVRLADQMTDVTCDTETLGTARDALEDVLFQASDHFEEQPSEDDYDVEDL